MQKLFFAAALFGCMCCCIISKAQQPAGDPNDTEFRKGWLLLLKVNNGMITTFKNTAPDLYVGGLQLNPQFTVAVNRLRIGANAGAFYAGKKISGLFGPMAALKLKSFSTNFGGLANLQLIAEHNWGTNKQMMFGGGLGLEILQKATVSFSVQRDYNLNNWWLQWHLGIKLNKDKKDEDDFNNKKRN